MTDNLSVKLDENWVQDEFITQSVGFNSYTNKDKTCVLIDSSARNAYQNLVEDYKDDELLTSSAVHEGVKLAKRSLPVFEDGSFSYNLEIMANYTELFPFQFIEGDSRGLQFFRHYLEDSKSVSFISIDVRCASNIEYDKFYEGVSLRVS